MIIIYIISCQSLDNSYFVHYILSIKGKETTKVL